MTFQSSSLDNSKDTPAYTHCDCDHSFCRWQTHDNVVKHLIYSFGRTSPRSAEEEKALATCRRAAAAEPITMKWASVQRRYGLIARLLLSGSFPLIYTSSRPDGCLDRFTVFIIWRTSGCYSTPIAMVVSLVIASSLMLN
ncbi:uncharacterized protein K460DRAFT_192824 [Cucurbitaria berberidis CBS 394.84]|uniref:Uncharacterized protein n=1 Tax=Cucurbitaria berberidis CBS 394.84 TaxID=1168544 RepID=A0A9P4G891_9PLEO|nr:uncharacterized protein K460DRAFT_192824 [Cucurbitaria berberidis CBS 394.84]KAF1840809.1 hypothetical protein K460DRAFT_192824 [Cucurbitaria berberidis CBS 394.84]